MRHTLSRSYAAPGSGTLEAMKSDPYIALTVQATGIHPASARLISIDALTFDESGKVHRAEHFVINPETDPGPKHVHGLSPEEIAAAPTFDKVLKRLGSLIDGRTLVVHNAPRTWGLIRSEAKRVMSAAAHRNRRRRRKAPQRVGHVPTPLKIIDTLASARRQGIRLADTRIGGVAHALGVPSPSPVATVERAARPAADVARERSEILLAIFLALKSGKLASYLPEDLVPDRFGLQRSAIRVQAAKARRYHNPGRFEDVLKQGMEVVVAPEIEVDPDEIIQACRDLKLNYSEKLTRETSLVVCNQRDELRGKAMHAQRKGIPLVRDVDFLAAAGRLN